MTRGEWPGRGVVRRGHVPHQHTGGVRATRVDTGTRTEAGHFPPPCPQLGRWSASPHPQAKGERPGRASLRVTGFERPVNHTRSSHDVHKSHPLTQVSCWGGGGGGGDTMTQCVLCQCVDTAAHTHKAIPSFRYRDVAGAKVRPPR